MAAHAPASALYPYFPTKQDAVEYFARREATLYTAQSLPQECCNCAASGDDVAGMLFYRFQWEKISGRWEPKWTDLLWFFMGFIRVSQRVERFRFTTHHLMCSKCSRSFGFRRAVANVLQFLGLFIVVLGMLVVPLFALMPFAVKIKPEERGDYVWTLFIIVLIFASGFLFLFFVPKLRVPTSLRYLGRSPFRSASVEKLGALD